MSMVDVAMYTIKHIKRLFISHVSEKVKSDFFRIVIEYSKSNGNLVAFYILHGRTNDGEDFKQGDCNAAQVLSF